MTIFYYIISFTSQYSRDIINTTIIEFFLIHIHHINNIMLDLILNRLINNCLFLVFEEKVSIIKKNNINIYDIE